MKLILSVFICSSVLPAFAQVKTDAFLEQLIRAKASDFLTALLNQPDTFRYQLIYTQIDRDKNNRPVLTNFYFNTDRNRYFNPASMVKLPTALMALEKLNKMKVKGVNKYTTMLTDSAYDKQTTVRSDTSSRNGLPSVAQYIKKVFLISDNEAYNRLYEFTGQQTLNTGLWEKGYTDTRITRRFVTMTEQQNRNTNPIRFMKDDRLVYSQPAAYSNLSFDFSKKIFIGTAHYNRDGSLIHAPMDFTTHNNIPLEDMQQMMQSVLFPSTVNPKQRFLITKNDRKFLLRYMSELPSESRFPNYDTVEYFDSYAKFFMFKAGRGRIPNYIRVFNKTGWSYGFLTDVAYIVDFKNKVEFMLSGNIYVNSDGILNDDKYEYEQTGYPFFKEIGDIIYQYELNRPRKHRPDLRSVRFNYEDDQ